MAQHCLVIGVDGSGKSTFLNGLEQHYGFEIAEPTSTPEARAFKARSTDLDVTPELVDEREQIYLALNSIFAWKIKERLDSGIDMAVTGNALVTRVSHALMRTIISGQDNEVSRSITSWVDDIDSHMPDQVVLIHAPDTVIRERIMERQEGGDATEKFWGFNAPYFLSRYQETWHSVLNQLIGASDIDCLALDSSALTPDAMLQQYSTSLQTTI